jgi:hypothetical protein
MTVQETFISHIQQDEQHIKTYLYANYYGHSLPNLKKKSVNL